ncbi:hypothetical protein PLESTF_000350000 [Pleodorina starrii]|nr:hypothetical protein PLESTF_000350000 [Pleodorina starrii]
MAACSSAIHDASPNAHLRDFLLRFFSEGPHLAALRYRICSKAIKLPLQAVVRSGPLQLPPSLPKEDKEDLQAIVRAQINDHAFVQTLVAQSAWDDSKMAAEFVTLLLADLTDLDARVCAAAFNSRKLGGMPSMAQVRLEPSGDLPAALAKAVAVLRAGDAGRVAMGGVTVPSSCTALAVALADCTALRAEEQQRNASVSVTRSVSYAHRFVLLVDGTGVGLYQAWGSGGGGGSTSQRQPP